MGYLSLAKEFTNILVPVVTAVWAMVNIRPLSRDLLLTAGTSERYGDPRVNVTPTYMTWDTGGVGGPGAMKATVDAVALFATTASLM